LGIVDRVDCQLNRSDHRKVTAGDGTIEALYQLASHVAKLHRALPRERRPSSAA
jgi:hypothetical protein